MTSVPCVNIVPTAHTRLVASELIAAAAKDTGFDAAIEHLHRVDVSQYPALIGLLLGNNTGRPRLEDEFTLTQRLEGHRRYHNGERDEWVINAEREYQRLHKRRVRARQEAS
jgi:hypothetical protein